MKNFTVISNQITKTELAEIFKDEESVAVLVVGPNSLSTKRAISSIKAVFDKKTVFDQSYACKIAGGLPEEEIKECLENGSAAIVSQPEHWTRDHRWRHGAIQVLKWLGAKTVVVFFIDPPIRVILWEIYRRHASLEALWTVVRLRISPPPPDGVDLLIKASE